MPSEDVKLQTLYAHYADTFSHIQATLARRDRLFLYVLIVISVMLLQAVAPGDTDQAVATLIGSKLGLSKPVPVTVLGSVVWFMLLGLTVRYYQAAGHIERQYDYIHSLEDQLSPLYGGTVFTREGRSYLTQYPWFSNWVWALYTIGFPLLLLALLAGRLIQEFCRSEELEIRLAFNALAFVAIAVSTLLYLALVHLRK